MDTQERTPSSLSGISVSSQATVIDLAQEKLEEELEMTNSIPDEISHAPTKNATDPV